MHLLARLATAAALGLATACSTPTFQFYTLTAVTVGLGRLAACGADNSSGLWRVVTVDLDSPKVETVVESSDAFPFLNAKVLLSRDGAHRALGKQPPFGSRQLLLLQT